MGLKFTGERYLPSVRGHIYYEHVHRYAIAAKSCSGKRVLDVASGEGYGAALLARSAQDVVGVDIDAEAIAHARRSYYVPNLRFFNAPATELPLAEASVDVITSFETIEHLSDHERMIDEFRRVLVPGGTLFISSPNKLVYSDRANYQNPFHVRELYYQEFRDLLKRRFANVAIYGQRLVASSVLHPLAGARSGSAGWYAGDVTAIDDGLPSLDDPLYFLAVCSDGPIPEQIASGFVDPDDNLFTHLLEELEVLRGRVTELDRLAVDGQDAAALPVAAAPDADEGQLVDAGSAAQRAERIVMLEGEAEAASAALAAATQTSGEQAERIGALESDVEELSQRATRYEASLAELQHVLAIANRTIEARDEVIAEHEAEIAHRDTVVAAREARIGDLKRAVVERDEEIRRRDALLAERNAMLARRDAAHTVSEARLAEFERLLAENTARMNAAMATQRGALETERDAALAERDALAAERSALLAELSVISARDATIADLEARLATCEAAVIEANERAQRDSLTLREILASRSWRMTEPMRRAASIVRPHRH